MWAISNVTRAFSGVPIAKTELETTLESRSLPLRDERGFRVDKDGTEAKPLLEAV